MSLDLPFSFEKTFDPPIEIVVDSVQGREVVNKVARMAIFEPDSLEHNFIFFDTPAADLRSNVDYVLSDVKQITLLEEDEETTVNPEDLLD